MVKAINLVRLFTIVLFLGILSLVYAYLDPMVQLTTVKGEYLIHRANFFYYSAGIFLVINMIMWMLTKMTSPLIESKFGEFSAGWAAGLPSVINFYLITLVGFIGVINNPNDVNAGDFEYLNYLGPVLLVVWLVGGVYIMATKKSFD